MLSRLHELIKAKNILILGFGREGRSTLNRILEVGDAASITIADGNEALTLPAAMEITTLSGEKKSVSSEEIKLLTGAHYMDSLRSGQMHAGSEDPDSYKPSALPSWSGSVHRRSPPGSSTAHGSSGYL